MFGSDCSFSKRGLEWGFFTSALLTFGVSSFSVGTIFGTVGYGAVSLASTHLMPGTPLVGTATDVSRHCPVSPGGRIILQGVLIVRDLGSNSQIHILLVRLSLDPLGLSFFSCKMGK